MRQIATHSIRLAVRLEITEVVERDVGMEIQYGEDPQPVEVAGRRDGDSKMRVSICRVTRSRLEMTNRSPKFFRC